MSIGARTYTPQQLHEISQAVYYKSMKKIEELLDGETDERRASPDRLVAYAACADAAACEIMSEDDYDSEDE